MKTISDAGGFYPTRFKRALKFVWHISLSSVHTLRIK